MNSLRTCERKNFAYRFQTKTTSDDPKIKIAWTYTDLYLVQRWKHIGHCFFFLSAEWIFKCTVYACGTRTSTLLVQDEYFLSHLGVSDRVLPQASGHESTSLVQESQWPFCAGQHFLGHVSGVGEWVGGSLSPLTWKWALPQQPVIQRPHRDMHRTQFLAIGGRSYFGPQSSSVCYGDCLISNIFFRFLIKIQARLLVFSIFKMFSSALDVFLGFEQILITIPQISLPSHTKHASFFCSELMYFPVLKHLSTIELSWHHQL